MPSFSFIPTLDARLIVSAGCVSNQPGASPHPNALIVSVTFEDGTPCTGLTLANFLVVSYEMSTARPSVIGLSPEGPNLNPDIISLQKEIPGIDFAGVYKFILADEDQFETPKVGQVVYVIKVSTNGNDIFHTRYHGQAVVSVVMQNQLR